MLSQFCRVSPHLNVVTVHLHHAQIYCWKQRACIVHNIAERNYKYGKIFFSDTRLFLSVVLLILNTGKPA